MRLNRRLFFSANRIKRLFSIWIFKKTKLPKSNRDYDYNPKDFEKETDEDSSIEKDYGVTNRDFLEDKYFK